MVLRHFARHVCHVADAFSRDLIAADAFLNRSRKRIGHAFKRHIGHGKNIF